MLLKTNKQLKIIFIGSLIQAAIVVFNSIFSKNSIMATVKDISDVYYIWYLSLMMYLLILIIFKIKFFAKLFNKMKIIIFAVILGCVFFFKFYEDTYQDQFYFSLLLLIAAIVTLYLVDIELDDDIKINLDSTEDLNNTKPNLDDKNIKEEENNFYVECINCNTVHTNPTNSLCTNCGKDIYKGYDDLKCKNCGGEYSSSLSTCPYCGQ